MPQHFGSLVFDRRTSRYYPFDHECTALLTAPGASLVPRGGARGFHDALLRRGWLTLDGRFAGEVLELEPPADHLAGPLAVHLEVTDACNLECRHCFAAAGTEGSTDLLTIAEIDALCAELGRTGSFRLGITGGEPLLRPDLLEILDCALARGLHPCVTTNGLLVDEHLARELGRRSLAWLNVSLDGATPETCDAIRGPGTFERVLDKLALLARHACFTLAFTVTRDNAHEIEECARLAREVGARAAVFRPLYPVGRACGCSELMPSYTDYADGVERIADIARELVGELEVIEPFGPLGRRGSQARIAAGCGAANLVASISCRGEVTPCSFLGAAVEAESLRDRPFAEIWHHGRAFVELRGPDPPGGFAGGCRARSLHLGGGLRARDPWLVACEGLS